MPGRRPALARVGAASGRRAGQRAQPHRAGLPKTGLAELLSMEGWPDGCTRSAAVGTWIFWLIVAAVLGAVEIATVTLAFGLVAVGALVAAIAGAAGAGLPIQFGAFVLASGIGLGVAQPIAMRHVRQPPLLRTGAAALVGRTAVVVQEVSADGGQVR